MFKSKYVFPKGTPDWIVNMNQRGTRFGFWVSRREDEIRMTLWKRLFG